MPQRQKEIIKRIEYHSKCKLFLYCIFKNSFRCVLDISLGQKKIIGKIKINRMISHGIYVSRRANK